MSAFARAAGARVSLSAAAAGGDRGEGRGDMYKASQPWTDGFHSQPSGRADHGEGVAGGCGMA